MFIVADSKIPHAETAFNQLGEVKAIPTKQMTNDAVKDADVILVRSETKVDASLLKGARARFVGTATIGSDHVDLEYLRKNNIGFASCPGSNANSVAEYVLAALLEVEARLGIPLKGKTLGVVGHGNTGSGVAMKAEAIGMNVLLNDPPLARTTSDSRYVPLDALMDADFISLHVPLTKSGEDATFHLFDGSRLAAMKAGSVLMNSSRGGVAETEAVKKALRTNHLRACVLDVWENEPNIDGELLQLVTIGTPHIAGYSHDGKLNATRMLQHALNRFFQSSIVQRNTFDASEQKKTIVLPSDNSDIEFLVRHAVQKCYNIERDDADLRQLLSQPEQQRGDYFRDLRAKYRVRREFPNYIINSNNISTELAHILSSVGFKLLHKTEDNELRTHILGKSQRPAT